MKSAAVPACGARPPWGEMSSVPEANLPRGAADASLRPPLRAHGRPSGAAQATTSRLRVVILTDCTSFKAPFTAGGTERQLSELALQLERCGVSVTVVARECADGLPQASEEPESARGSPLVVAPRTAEPSCAADASARSCSPRTLYVPPAPVPKGLGWAALGPNLRYIACTWRLLLRARREYDVLIVSGFRQLALPMALLAWIARKHCILRIDAAWDLDDELSPESNARIGHAAKHLASAVIRASRGLAFRLADHVVAFSEPIEQRLLRMGAAPGKVRLIPNGVDAGHFAPVSARGKAALRARLGLPSDRPIFIYTGRICRSKGLIELMHVWERLSTRSEAYLVLVGTGEGSHESCEAEVREACARRPGSIEWRGVVENVAQYLQASDAFIFLSYTEAFSLSILEAVCVGLPCIVADVGCAREIVGHHDNGAIVPVRAEPQAVVREIEWLLARRSQWEAMGARGRERVVAGYALEAVAARYVELCEAHRSSGARGA